MFHKGLNWKFERTYFKDTKDTKKRTNCITEKPPAQLFYFSASGEGSEAKHKSENSITQPLTNTKPAANKTRRPKPQILPLTTTFVK